MVDFKILVEALLKSAPWAVFAAAVGVIWQLVYVHGRDKVRDAQVKRELEQESKKFEHQQVLESNKFEYQQHIEAMKFEYEQRRWREQLSLQLALKHVDARLEEYSKAWSYVEAVAKHKMADGDITPEVTKAVAGKIKTWRYSKGGLLAEETTRDAAYTFQRALWGYDGSKEGYDRIRHARKLFRYALRADTGLGEDVTGQSIYDAAEERQKIRDELGKLQQRLGITPSSDL